MRGRSSGRCDSVKTYAQKLADDLGVDSAVSNISVL
jgi:hypothetical protein